MHAEQQTKTPPQLHDPHAVTTAPPYAEVRRWLFETCLPFWAQHGVDRTRGGFVEHFALDGSDAHVPFKRTRVTARQIYVFSHAAVLGVPGAAEIASHGVAFLERAWLGEDGGWARRLDPHGRVIDATPDLYDLAFVLFAFGWHARATGRSESRDWAARTLTFIERHMRHPLGGFLAEKPASGPRLQNPHMHLFEASLACLEATGEARFRKMADELAELVSRRLFQPGAGTLPEYYDDGLCPLGGAEGRITEPGHHFEWAWILAWYQRLTGTSVRGLAVPLVDFAERYGVDHATGAVHASVRDDGLVLDRSQRIWPMCERLQAAVAMHEIERRDPSAVLAPSAERLLARHLAHRPAGTWVDIRTPAGGVGVDKIPASTLYHLVIAFTEMLRTSGGPGTPHAPIATQERTS